jgi:GT2 family glycosyltransferase
MRSHHRVLEQCRASRRRAREHPRHTTVPYRLIVVDNASDEKTLSLLRAAARDGRYGEMVLVENRENLGWVKGINRGLAVSDAPYVCFMNNDLRVAPGWLGRMLRTLEEHPEIGIANPEEWREDRDVPDEEIAERAESLARRARFRFSELDYCSGFCLLVRRAVIEKIGGFDEAYEMGYYEDEDYSRRVSKAGWLCVRCHEALVFHRGSQSFGQDWARQREIAERNRRLYEARWGVKKRLLLWARYPAAEEILRLARQGVEMYVVRNRYVKPSSFPHPHGNIKFRGFPAGAWLEGLYFLVKARYLFRRGRIEYAVIKYAPGPI